MKKLLFLFTLMFSPMLASAQTVSDVQNSGCMRETQSAASQWVPTIVLTKEGSTLSVQLLNYVSNCCTDDFNVTSNISGGSDGEPCSIAINVVPVVEYECDCNCPFNVSFTVHDLEPNSFYLDCWWYDGQVELTEGEPLVLEYKTEDVVIDGLNYQLLKTTRQAKLLSQNTWDDKPEILQIPSEVEYGGEKYTVTSINSVVFGSNNSTKKIIIPKTVKNTDFGSLEGFTSHPFSGCLSLESIEVEEGNPAICSVDGVLFNKDKTTLIGFPSASPRELYTVPDGVKSAANGAFINNKYLKKVILPSSMETLGLTMFRYCNSLEEVIFSSNIKELPSYLFKNCTKLKSVVIPNGVTTIGYSAFEGCSSLESISMPESVAVVGTAAFRGCTSLKSATLSPNLKEIPLAMFRDCSKLAEVIIPCGITSIGNGAFMDCKAMQSFDLPESINYIDGFAFKNLSNLKEIYCYAKTVPNTNINTFRDVDLSKVTLHVPAASIDNYQSSSPWNQFGAIVPLETEMSYRPMIEEGKVWKIGGTSENPVQWVEYYYFDGDTIIDGKTCKQMMCQRYYGPDYHNDVITFPIPDLRNVGAWYEEDKKVYCYNAINHQLKMMYDFSLEANDTLLVDNEYLFVVGPKQTGGLKGYKGIYRDVLWCHQNGSSSYSTTWLEGVGSIDGPTNNVFYSSIDRPPLLMSCTVGDEVIYLNDEYEDGATPEGMTALKKRFDFTHTTKLQPKNPRRGEEELSLYGEYNDKLLGINLDPLDDAYRVSITNESGKVVYEKTVNAGTIVGLSIDISANAKGRYTVTVENSNELFAGEFETETTGIEVIYNKVETKTDIYNLQGQRLSSLQRGLNIVNGQKVYVK